MALSTTEQEVVTARILNLRNELVEKFFEAFGDAGIKFDAESIQREIISDLTKERRALVLKMLGFDDRWGKLEVDHCNNRASVASEFVKANVGPAVQKWADECLRPAIEARGRDKLNNTAVMKAIMREFDREFMDSAHEQMRYLASEAGKEFADTLAAQIKSGIKLAQE